MTTPTIKTDAERTLEAYVNELFSVPNAYEFLMCEWWAGMPESAKIDPDGDMGPVKATNEPSGPRATGAVRIRKPIMGEVVHDPNMLLLSAVANGATVRS